MEIPHKQQLATIESGTLEAYIFTKRKNCKVLCCAVESAGKPWAFLSEGISLDLIVRALDFLIQEDANGSRRSQDLDSKLKLRKLFPNPKI